MAEMVAVLLASLLPNACVLLTPDPGAWTDRLLDPEGRWRENAVLCRQVAELEKEQNLGRKVRGLVVILGHDWTMNEEGPNPKEIACDQAYEALRRLGKPAIPYVEEGLQSSNELIRSRCADLLRELKSLSR